MLIIQFGMFLLFYFYCLLFVCICKDSYNLCVQLASVCYSALLCQTALATVKLRKIALKFFLIFLTNMLSVD